ncbi:MAG TPA: class I SAM-dependent methyltransferase [Chlamydiales bacterium]|nr:class I SAM-dependent methyltransferase [Chlamydiales bacterium]
MKLPIFFLLFFSILCADPVEDLKKQVCDAIPNCYGWCTKEKAVSFIDLVLEVKPELCVEIGAFGGRSVLPVAAALKFLDQGLLVAIDPWSKEEALRYLDPIKDLAHYNWWAKVNYEQIYQSCLHVISQNGLEDYVITLRSTSEYAAPAIGMIDILYFDGNHSEIASVKDAKLYLPKVRPGGYIWINDALWSDMQAALDLIAETCDFVKWVDNGNCILFRKRAT